MPPLRASQPCCPTCGAQLGAGDLCRRCKSDLRLLRAAMARYDESRLACLRSIRQGDPHGALARGYQCHRLRPGPESRMLLALAHLIAEDWPAALEQMRLLDPGLE